jgi:hypothetical protein
MKGRKGSASFCEQKEAKKLCYREPCWFHHHRFSMTKVFAPLFSKSGPFLVSDKQV